MVSRSQLEKRPKKAYSFLAYLSSKEQDPKIDNLIKNHLYPGAVE